MDNAYVLLATFTYPHETHFLKSFLNEHHIRYKSEKSPSLMRNCFYSHSSDTYKVFVHENDLHKLVQPLNKLKNENHIENHFTHINYYVLDKSNKPSKFEKKFCWACYAIMVSALGVAIYLIIKSLAFLF